MRESPICTTKYLLFSIFRVDLIIMIIVNYVGHDLAIIPQINILDIMNLMSESGFA